MELKKEKIDDWELHALEFENDQAIIMKIVKSKLLIYKQSIQINQN